MQFVFLLQAAQNRDRVLDTRLGHEHGLEAPRKCCILLDILAVFIERGRPDAMKFAAGKRRLQQVGCVHCAFRSARTHDGVHLVDEQNDVPVTVGHFVEHGLEPFFELAAILRAGDESPHVERQQLFVAQTFGDISIDDP